MSKNHCDYKYGQEVRIDRQHVMIPAGSKIQTSVSQNGHLIDVDITLTQDLVAWMENDGILGTFNRVVSEEKAE